MGTCSWVMAAQTPPMCYSGSNPVVPCQEPGTASALGTGFPSNAGANCSHGCCRAVCEQAMSSLLPPSPSLPPPGLDTVARAMPPPIPGQLHGGATTDRDTSQRLQCNPIWTLFLSQVVPWNPGVPALPEERARMSVHLPVPAHWHQEGRDPQANAVGT